MKKLKINLENCFGIKKLNHEFEFNENSNVQLIYAKNGTMKTSFAKTFEKIQLEKEEEIKDLIHNKQPVKKEIKIVDENGNENKISKEEIFVIKSFVPSYESENIATLLVNDELKGKISEVLELKESLLKNLEKKSGIKISGTSGGRIEYRLEPQILSDFGIKNESFLKNLDTFWDDSISDEYKDVKYSDIFDAIDIIKSDDFQNNIKDFLKKSDEIYSKFTFLDKGKFTLAKLKKVQKELKKQSFFVKENKIKLGDEDISEDGLKNKVKEIEKNLQDTDEFRALEKLLQKPKGIPLKDTIESYPSIIEKLKLENLEDLRKELWQCYFKENEELFNDLKNKFKEIESEISTLNTDETAWNKAIELFNDRFFLPFRMEISNIESSVMGESLPKVIFKFPKDGNFENNAPDNWEELDRKNLEEKDVLSQGEKRALYLLNIIFEVEVRKKSNQKTLFIIDDIADSFDYKNKYAIVEYLRDLSQEKKFYLIILTHNFDFFRTVQKRIVENKWKNSFIAQSMGDEIKLEKAGSKSIVDPFTEWKTNLNNDFKSLIPSIPFIRNLIEFRDGNKTKEYLTLTYVLHQKNEEKKDNSGNILSKKTDDILISDLEGIFKEVIKDVNFKYSEEDKSKKVIDVIFDNADDILKDDNNDSIAIGNKIILSIAIRLKAEKLMWSKITDKSPINGSQTGKLFQRYKNEFGNNSDQKETLRILDSVNIMSPENIHLNSFMYEPILDMDILELKNLYEKVSSLLKSQESNHDKN